MYRYRIRGPLDRGTNKNHHAWIDRPNAEELVFINGCMSDSSDSD